MVGFSPHPQPLSRGERGALPQERANAVDDPIGAPLPPGEGLG